MFNSWLTKFLKMLQSTLVSWLTLRANEINVIANIQKLHLESPEREKLILDRGFKRKMKAITTLWTTFLLQFSVWFIKHFHAYNHIDLIHIHDIKRARVINPLYTWTKQNWGIFRFDLWFLRLFQSLWKM